MTFIFIRENFFPKTYKNKKTLYFEKGGKFRDCWGHKTGTRLFPYYESILNFLENNPGISIYFTLNEEVESFKKISDTEILVNMSSYISFCDCIGTKRIERAQAFFSSALDIDKIFTNESRDKYVTLNSSEKTIIEALKQLDIETQKHVLFFLNDILGDSETSNCDQEIGLDHAAIFEKLSLLSTDEKARVLFFRELSRYQVETLKQLVEFLKNNLDKGEVFIQNWIDEENGKYRKQRCLIFGLEYVDPKREGRASQKKFDILADQTRESHILIELKSPNASVFKISERSNQNDGVIADYQLSPELSRAIPQILEYKDLYYNSTLVELQAMCIDKKKTISKCIIVIGRREDNQVWKQHFDRLHDSMNIEIVTYTDLIDKLENTINNLRENTQVIKENE
ncbi:MAG: DUF4263 domain-containing protein [Patescibacteria group bacterium]|nr:DUF4263 domain-containing protein [Patescibacteria group bacterium]